MHEHGDLSQALDVGVGSPTPPVPTERCEAPKPRHISTVLRQSSGVPAPASRRPSMPKVAGSRPASRSQPWTLSIVASQPPSSGRSGR